jgi:porphobilinogen deaminase
VILAAAGLKRLSLSDKISQYLPKDDYVPAAGQGVLCIQAIKNKEYVLKTLKGLVVDEVDRCASEERDFISQFDGDCFSPIAAHCYIKNNKSTLIGYVSSTDGNRFIKTKIVENVNEMRGIGKKLAKIMIEQGAKKILETK